MQIKISRAATMLLLMAAALVLPARQAYAAESTAPAAPAVCATSAALGAMQSGSDDPWYEEWQCIAANALMVYFWNEYIYARDVEQVERLEYFHCYDTWVGRVEDPDTVCATLRGEWIFAYQRLEQAELNVFMASFTAMLMCQGWGTWGML